MPLSKTKIAREQKSAYALGVTLLIASALTFSTAGIFTKGVTASAWEVIFWRGLFAALATTLWITARGSLKRDFMAMGRSGLAVGIIGAAGTAAFIPAFKITTIANVALIYSVAPLLAALLAWTMVRERMDARTIAGAVGAILGVGIIVSGSLGTLSVQGDALALIMTAAMATIMVIYRAYPSTPSGGPSVLQSLILLPFCVFFGEPLRTSPAEIAVLAAFGVLFAIASVTLAEGAKRVPAGQTALIGALETPLAIALGIAVLAEFPGNATAIGGAVVLCGVVYSIRWRAA